VGTPEEIYESPQTRFVADFIGLSNFIEGMVTSIDDRGRAVLSLEGLELCVPAPPDVRGGQRLLVFVRPNEVQLFTLDYSGGENTFEGVIEKMTYLGDKIDYRINLGGLLEVRVQTDGMQRFERGERVKVRLPIERCRAISGD